MTIPSTGPNDLNYHVIGGNSNGTSHSGKQLEISFHFHFHFHFITLNIHSRISNTYKFMQQPSQSRYRTVLSPKILFYNTPLLSYLYPPLTPQQPLTCSQCLVLPFPRYHLNGSIRCVTLRPACFTEHNVFDIHSCSCTLGR